MQSSPCRAALKPPSRLAVKNTGFCGEKMQRLLGVKLLARGSTRGKGLLWGILDGTEHSFSLRGAAAAEQGLLAQSPSQPCSVSGSTLGRNELQKLFHLFCGALKQVATGAVCSQELIPFRPQGGHLVFPPTLSSRAVVVGSPTRCLLSVPVHRATCLLWKPFLSCFLRSCSSRWTSPLGRYAAASERWC